MGAGEEILKTLARIEAKLDRVLGGQASSAGPAVAPDSELESQYGNPQVRRDPKRWAGASYVGANYSECPTDYLLCLAESLEYFANKNKGDPNAKKAPNGRTFYWEYDLKDAARARGWAARNRGKVLPPPGDGGEGGGPDSAGDANEDWAP